MAILCPKCHSENADTSRYCSSCAAPLSGAEAQGIPSVTKTLQTPVIGLAKSRIVAGKYRILEEIGRGGMGVVYKAEDTKLQRTVALKFLPHQWVSDPDARERFIQEARAASALDHPNICNIHEIEETEDGRMYIAMACYEGESLREKIKRGPLKQEEALSIASQAATGLAKAHQKGIIHRDIKPANILITKDDAAKIVDFGLAKLVGQVKLTREGTTIGTIAYMSPEQARGEAVDQRTDIWSLGVVLYEMLSGVLPFKGDYDQTVIHSILHQEPTPIAKARKDLPTGLGDIVTKTLQKHPADRYQSMDELLEDLKAITEGLKPFRARAGLFQGRLLGLKKIYAYPVMACLAVLAVLAVLFLFPKRGQAFDSIAVLPLANLSGDSEQEYFSDGMHEALITELSRFKTIHITSRTSVLGYKGTTKRIPEIARELGVTAIVEGSTVRSGNIVRINVQLIDGQSDKHLWADNFDREYRDVLALQSEAALAIAKQIQATLTPEEVKAATRKNPVNPEAYEAYLKGMFIISRLNAMESQDVKPTLEKSIQYFEQSLGFDRNFAPAYAGLAWAYDFYALSSEPKIAFAKAKDAAQAALSLDDSLAEAHAVLADIKTTFDWAWDGAEREWKRALELNPNYAYAHVIYASMLAALGRTEEAIPRAELAMKLDPNSYMTRAYAATVYSWGARQYDRSLALTRESLSLFPNDAGLLYFLAEIYLLKGSYKEAFEEYQKSLAAGGAPNLFWLARAYALTGEKPKALAAINDLLKREKEEYVDPMFFAWTYAALGENDKAIDWLEIAYEKKSPNLMTIRMYPLLDPLRSDPRYAALLKKMGMAQ